MTPFRKDQTSGCDPALRLEEARGAHLVLTLNYDDGRLRSVVGQRSADVPFDRRWLDTRQKKGYSHPLACAGSRSGGIFFDGDEADDKQHIELLKEVFPLHDERPLLFSVIPQQFPPPGLNRFSNF